MSHPIGKSGARIRTAGLVVLGVGVLLFVASALIPGSGAWFYASRTGTVTSSTGSFGLLVTDEKGADIPSDIAMTFTPAPGAPQSVTYTVKNTGTVPGYVTTLIDGYKLTGGNPMVDTVDPAKLTFSVNGGTPIAANATLYQNLGTLAGGASMQVTVGESLSPLAGNEWQNATVTHRMAISLNQVR